MAATAEHLQLSKGLQPLLAAHLRVMPSAHHSVVHSKDAALQGAVLQGCSDTEQQSCVSISRHEHTVAQQYPSVALLASVSSNCTADSSHCTAKHMTRQVEFAVLVGKVMVHTATDYAIKCDKMDLTLGRPSGHLTSFMIGMPTQASF